MLMICAVLALASYASAALAPTRLRVEYIDSPRGVDVVKPRFSFALNHEGRGQTQAAYQIVVTSDSKPGDSNPVWDSGKVSSPKSLNIQYGGDALKSDTAYSWTVKSWDKAGDASPFSAPSTFTTGLFAEEDWKGAKWIGVTTNAPGRQLRATFQTSKVVSRATAYCVGLGYYKLFVNGQKVSDHELGPFLTFEKRVYYDSLDVTAALKSQPAGLHVLAAVLGNGWYNQPKVAKFTKGAPKMMLRLSVSFTDGTSMDVVSNAGAGTGVNADGVSWQQHQSPIVMDDIYAGETYNATLETPGWDMPGFDASGWAVAEEVAAPSPNTTVSSHAVLPPIRIGQTYSPCDLWQSSPGVYVFDFCQNMAGFTTLHIPAGLVTSVTSMSMLHAEAIHGPPPSEIFHHYSNTAETTTYVTRGDGAAVDYTPYFTYMGFRYVRLEGYPGVPDQQTLSAHFVHTNFELIGSVGFSDPDLDAVQHITRTASLSNFQSIPTDCPQRERFGWLGDAQLSTETTIHNFDMGGAYTSFVRVIADSQEADGNVQDCVPWYGHGHEQADPAWGSAYTFIADWVGSYYDDDEIFRVHYNGIKDHLEALRTQAKADKTSGLLTFSWWGDWCPPSGCHMNKAHHNSAIVSSFMYIKQIRIMAKMAKILGHDDDAADYAALDKAVSAAFVSRFYDSTTHVWSEPGRTAVQQLTIQTTTALAIELGLVPDADTAAVTSLLVHDVMVKNNGHLNVGIVGVKYLLSALSQAGRTDVALQVSQTPDEPGWVYMVKQGATTLWETWTGTRYQPKASWNHIMFGANSEWYYKYLAGILLDLPHGGRGYDKIVLAPQVWTPQMSAGNGTSATATSAVTGSASNDGAHVASPTGVFTDPVTGFSSGICPRLSSVEASMVTTRGTLAAAWQCVSSATVTSARGGPAAPPQRVFEYNVTIPVGSTASVRLPGFGMGAQGVKVTEGGTAVFADGKFLEGVDGISAGAFDAKLGAVGLTVGSGTYAFDVSVSV